jgi:hypothetical protein
MKASTESSRQYPVAIAADILRGHEPGGMIVGFDKASLFFIRSCLRRFSGWLASLRLPPLFSATAPGAISTKERLQHVRYQCCGSDRFVEPAVLDRIGIKLFLERLWQHNGEPHRALPGQWTKFQISPADERGYAMIGTTKCSNGDCVQARLRGAAPYF